MKKKNTEKSKLTPEYDSQRQQNVLLEDIHKQVKTIAEGHSGLDRKIDKTNKIIDGMSNKLDIISTKITEHEKRFDRIEMVLTDTNARVKNSEHKLDNVTTDYEQRIQKLETIK